MSNNNIPHIAIIGGGFGGLEAARALAKADVRITLIDKHNHHLFQPLLYQVATAALSPADIASPIRWILKSQKNVTVMLGEVIGIDPGRKTLTFHDQELEYDYLIIAAGMTHSYFGQNQWARHAPGLKLLSEAVEIRRQILLAFETAEKCVKSPVDSGITTFAVIGGGATGVEMAGAIAELARVSLKQDFRRVDPGKARIILFEAGPRLLPDMPEKLSDKSKIALEKLGVEVRLSSPVTDIREDHLMIGDERINTRTVVWAAGLSASPLTGQLGAECDRIGRVKVNPDLTIPGHETIFAIGDLVHIKQKDGTLVPGMAPGAIQMGRTAAKNILSGIAGESTKPFKYLDKGSMATIGRAAAVANVGPVSISGMPAWLAWLGIHILFLIGFRNRLMVMLQWGWSYLTFQRHARLITHPWRFWQPGLPDRQIPKQPGCHCRLKNPQDSD